MSAIAAPAAPFDVLVATYPDRIASRDGDALVWRDGTRMEVGTVHAVFDDAIEHASLADMFRLAYPAGAPLAAPAQDFDPGRFRNRAFFDKLYGDCRAGAVETSLVSVVWLPKSWGHSVKITPRAAEALREVSDRALALIAEKAGEEKRSLIGGVIGGALSIGESITGLFSRSGDVPRKGRARKAQA